MKVLIVEDEFASRMKLERVLNNMGYETLLAENGQEGFDIWRNERPRFIITDWLMPELDGLELTKKIRQQEGNIYTYIVMLTLKKESGDIIQGLAAGVDEFISKPYTKEELELRIRTGIRIIEAQSKDSVVMAISRLAESRDPETGGHLDRIRYYSRALAEQLEENGDFKQEITKNFIENIFLTSPLHDIGKIGIPDCILLKNDRLSDAEYNIVKSHTTIGYNALVSGVKKDVKGDYMVMSAEIAYYHHEKYNGNGYPIGLKGEQIPLCARIVALADVYDALVSKRVYKCAYTHEVAKDIIRKERGEHFDPVIVDAFFRCEKKFERIRNDFSEEKN